MHFVCIKCHVWNPLFAFLTMCTGHGNLINGSPLLWRAWPLEILSYFNQCFLKEIGILKLFILAKSSKIAQNRNMLYKTTSTFVSQIMNGATLWTKWFWSRRRYKLTKLACRASVHYFEGSSQFYGEGPFKKMTQEVVKVTGAVDFFAHSPFVMILGDVSEETMSVCMLPLLPKGSLIASK